MSYRVACGGSKKAIPSRIDGLRQEAGESLWGVCVLCPHGQESVNEQGQNAVFSMSFETRPLMA